MEKFSTETNIYQLFQIPPNMAAKTPSPIIHMLYVSCVVAASREP